MTVTCTGRRRGEAGRKGIQGKGRGKAVRWGMKVEKVWMKERKGADPEVGTEAAEGVRVGARVLMIVTGKAKDLQERMIGKRKVKHSYKS